MNKKKKKVTKNRIEGRKSVEKRYNGICASQSVLVLMLGYEQGMSIGVVE